MLVQCRVIYATSGVEVDWWCKRLLDPQLAAIGWDIEWKVTFKRGAGSITSAACRLQAEVLLAGSGVGGGSGPGGNGPHIAQSCTDRTSNLQPVLPLRSQADLVEHSRRRLQTVLTTYMKDLGSLVRVRSFDDGRLP